MRSLWLLLLVSLPACHGLGNNCATYKPLVNPMALAEKLKAAQKLQQPMKSIAETLPVLDPKSSQAVALGKNAVVIIPKHVPTTTKSPVVTAPPLAQTYTGMAPGDMSVVIPNGVKIEETTSSSTTTTTTTTPSTTSATSEKTTTEEPTSPFNPVSLVREYSTPRTQIFIYLVWR